MYQVQLQADYDETQYPDYRNRWVVLYSRHLITRLHAERLAELWRLACCKPPMDDTSAVYTDQYAKVPDRFFNLRLRVFDTDNDNPNDFPMHNYRDRRYGPTYNSEARDLMNRYDLDHPYGRWTIGEF